jgi:hypothetical protein
VLIPECCFGLSNDEHRSLNHPFGVQVSAQPRHKAICDNEV